MASQPQLLQQFVGGAADREMIWTLRDQHGQCALVVENPECDLPVDRVGCDTRGHRHAHRSAESILVGGIVEDDRGH